MKTNKYLSFAALAFSLLCSVVYAHHSTRGIYDEEHEVELTGVVKAWRFINPHPYLTFEVEAEDGTVNEWDVSYGGSAVVHLQRQGYTAETFKPGDVIVVTGKPAKAEGAFGVLIEGKHPKWPDGTQVVKGGSVF